MSPRVWRGGTLQLRTVGSIIIYDIRYLALATISFSGRDTVGAEESCGFDGVKSGRTVRPRAAVKHVDAKLDAIGGTHEIPKGLRNAVPGNLVVVLFYGLPV